MCTATWEVHDQIVEPFEGGYAAYILQRVERDRMAAATEAKRQNLARKELAWLRRGAPARTSKPKFRIDAANALIADVPAPRDKVSLQRSPSPGSARTSSTCSTSRLAMTAPRCCTTSNGGSRPASGPASSASTARASPPCSA